MPYSACVRCRNCDGFPCLVHAQVRRRGDRRAAGAGAPQRDAADQRPRRCGWRPTRPATAVTGVVVERDGARGALRRRHRRGLLRRGQLGQAAAAPRPTTATRTAWPTAPTRSAATTCSTTARRCWRCPASRTRRYSRRRWASTTSTSRGRDFDYPMGNIQMVGKSQAPMYRGEKPGETQVRADWALRGRGPARGRLLAVHRGPSAPGQPGDARRATGTIRAAYTAEQRRAAAKRLYQQLKSMLGKLGMHQDHLLPPLRVHEERDPGGRRARTRRARAGSAPTRPPPCSTATAGPTSWTTCTSSTPASSPASAR